MGSQIVEIIKAGHGPTYVKWVLRYLLKGNWRLGTEMAFWDVELNKIRPEGWIEPMFKDVYPALETLKRTFDEHPIILELGPGPRSRLTEGYDKKLYDLVAVDPLADEYRRNLKGREFLLQGKGEEVNKIFPEETFHMTYASNVLDHVEDPVQCFINMYRLTKIGGIIMVQGNEREGTRMNWAGLHQHDLSIYNRSLCLESHTGFRCLIDKGLGISVLNARRSYLDGNPWFSISWRRRR